MTTAADRCKTLTLVRRKITDDEDGKGIVRVRLEIRCDSCGMDSGPTTPANWPENQIANFFRGKGWAVDAKCHYAVCPKCQEKPKVVEIQSGIMRRHKQFFDLLDQFFDVTAGRYQDGWSDKRIAAETGLSENAVTAGREENYGPLKISPELIAVGREIGAIRSEVATLREMVTQLETRLTTAETTINKAIKGAA